MKPKILMIVWACAWLFPFTSYTDEKNIQTLQNQQQTSKDVRFIEGKNAALRGDWPTVLSIYKELQHYPLQSYLMFFYLKENIKTVDDSLVQKYIQEYPNASTSADLSRKWYVKLAENKQWKKLVEVYQPTFNVSNNTTVQCYYLNGLLETGNQVRAFSDIEQLWLSGKPLPDNCNPMFDTWLNQVVNKDELVWKRFDMALRMKHVDVAKAVINKMSMAKQNDATAVLKLYEKPSLVTTSEFVMAHSSSEVISYGIARLARQDPNQAIHYYQRMNKQYHFTQEQRQRIFQSIALRFAMRKNSEADVWFRKIIDSKLDPVYQEWMIAAALYNNDWKLVKDRIQALTPIEQQTPQWRYWYARALDKLGNKEEAKKIFTEMAAERTYYGFLSSQYVNKTIEIKHDKIEVTSKEIQDVANMPAMQRAKLLYQLKQQSYAALELYYLMKHCDPKQQYIVMKLVSDWGWVSQTLRLNRSNEAQDDITLRFPLLYYNVVMENANKRQIDPALIYAMIRQESLFSSNVKSPVGAVGLMQLMPATAARTAKEFNLKYVGTDDLLNSTTNIEFGSAHIRKLYGQLGNNPVLVIAAYNAGKDAVNRWVSTGHSLPMDIWIELVPFHETRNYIKNVIAYYVIYQERLGQKPTLEKVNKVISNTKFQSKSTKEKPE